MNLSDLLHAHVVDVDGNDVGSVDDVCLVQDGPLLEPFGAAFRVEGLAIGHRAIGRRLGYHHGGLTAPWLVRVILDAFTANSRYVAWDDVETWDGAVIRITKRKDELRPVRA